MADSLTGSVVAGYRLERPIGRGGMGVVYEAVDVELGRRVALKLIAPEFASDHGFRERFVAESRLAASIEHPAVLPIYRAAEAEGVLFLAMRLVVGDDLATIVRDHGPLDPERAASIVAQVAGALDAAHARRLVHRDVKPANVLIDADGRAYLTDFGLARDLGDPVGHTRTGVVVGTPDYLAPEQIRAGTIGPWTDVYALGCVLFFLLTGRVVFPLDSPMQKLWAHVSEPPARPSTVRPDIPHQLDLVLQRALAKDPDARWPTATALATATHQATAHDEAQGAYRGSVTDAPRAARHISSAQMVGRAAQLVALEAALVRATGGVPQFVLLAGDAGIGKTRLAREFAERATSAGCRVLWGECVPIQAGELPYAPIVAALRGIDAAGAPGALDGELEALLPGLGQLRSHVAVSGLAAKARLFELLLGFLSRLGAEAPVLLVIEDVHWADRATQDLLRFLARNLGDQRLLVLITQRSDEPALPASLLSLLVELGREDRTQCIDLAPLTREESAQQLAGIAEVDVTLVESVYGLSEGNPYFAEELLAARTADGIDEALPASLRDLLRLRLAGLSNAATSILGVVATAGRDVVHDLLRQAAAIDQAQLDAALHELIDAHVLVCDPTGERFAFRHALAREGVYRDLLAGERRALHAALAEALERVTREEDRGPAEWAALAQHWAAANRHAAALRACIAAARAATAVYAFSAARGHLGRARSLWHDVPPAERPVELDERELLQRLAEATRLDGDRHAAIAIVESALALVNPETQPQEAADLHELLGRLHRSPTAAVREFRRALRLLSDGPSAQRASVMLEISRMRQYGQMPSTVLAPALDALAVARAASAVAQQGRAHEQLGKAYTYAGDPETGVAHYLEAIRVAAELGRGEDLATATTNLGGALIMLGRVEEAFARLEAGLDDVRRMGLAQSHGVTIEAHLADCELRLGRWSESRERLDRLLRGTLQDADHRLLVLGLQMALDARAGRYDSAATVERAAAGLMDADLWPQTVVIANCARAELALLRGDPDAASTIVAQTRRAIVCGDLLWWPALLSLGIRAEADRAIRARAEGREDVVSQARVAADELLGSTEIQGSLRWARFELPVAEPVPPETHAHREQGDAELARLVDAPRPDLWVEIIARWDDLGNPYQAAYARLRGAEALLATGGNRTVATSALDRARTALQQLDAAPLLGAVDAVERRAWLDPSGGAAVPGAPQVRTPMPPGSTTMGAPWRTP